MAPQAFRAVQFRAVRAEDYAAAAQTLPWVQMAGAAFRWTGSWMTAFTSVDPRGSEIIDVNEHVELVELLNRRRLACYESYAPAPQYISLDLRIEVCVDSGWLDGDGYLYAIAILDPRADFWDIDFPAPQSAPEALARLLMECSFCQRREVVYLNEPEVKSFEVRKCVARLCTHCDSPSIWIEAQPEASTDNASTSNGDERVFPRRNRTRVKARVLACIRRRGFAEEVAVCEDLSKGGLSFRSRNQYDEGSRVEVAVPFTPGSAAISAVANGWVPQRTS